MFKKGKETNLVSIKTGIRLTNLLIPNTSIIMEYTRTNPWVYRHPVSTTTFESNKYNMGHYLRENSDEIYLAVRVKPLPKLIIDCGYVHARKGPVIEYQLINGITNAAGAVFMQSVEWQNRSFNVKARYEIINDGFVFAEFLSSNIQGNVYEYTPEFYWANPNTFNVGMNFGF